MKVPLEWSVYIARCVDGSLYTGVAKDVKARLAAHNAGRGAAYTRSRRPVRLVYREDGFTRSAALSREAGIKSLERAKKLSLLKKALRRPLAAALILLGAAAARATPTFDKENPVVFSSAAPQAFTGSYPAERMYFIRIASQTEVGSATSPDGISWTEEGGGRLSTATLPSVSASSITGAGVLPLTGGGFRMLYSIVSTTGAYRIHSATSADGLSWANDTGTRIDNGATFLGSPKLVVLNDSSWRLYYTGTVGGAFPANRQIFTSRSTNQGLAWSAPSVALATAAYEVGASTLTNGLVRLYYTQPLAGSATSTVVMSALSADTNGTSFNIESGTRISTAAASGSVSFPVPVRSTDSYRWRLYYDFGDPGVLSTADVHTALTGAPAPVTLSPSAVQNITSTQTFTISGDVFSSPAPTFYLSLGGQPIITGTNVVRNDDQSVNVDFNVYGAAPGQWDLTTTNADGRITALAKRLLIDFPGGSVSLVNNLLRPRTGGSTSITINSFNSGHLLARLHTLDGRFVRTLYDGPMTQGQTSLSWDGRDASGATVSSGVYLLRVVGPKIDVKNKIVVVR